MSNGDYAFDSATQVTLSGAYSGATATPTEVGFYWGTSANELTNKVTASVTAGGDGSGSFSAALTGLTSGQTYVYQAYVKVAGTGAYATEENWFYASDTRFFTLSAGSQPAVDKDWLEMTSGLEGARYVVNTTYSGGERNYTHFYDLDMMTSLWTAYPLNSSHMGSLSRPGSWSYNPAIDTKYQVNVISSSYGGSYSRGHLCPNGSRNGNSTMQKQTFYVTNQVPQIQNGFNGTIWNALENGLQDIGKSEQIYIVTGVAFNKVGETKTVKYLSVGSQKVPVPNYFYKVALRVKYNGSSIVSACTVGFWFEHKAYSDNGFENYSVSVDQIEEWTGFDFFLNLPDNIETAAESASTSWTTFKSF